MSLPVMQINEETEIVPGEDTGHTRAHGRGVDHLDVLMVGFPVDIEEVLSFGGEEAIPEVAGDGC